MRLCRNSAARKSAKEKTIMQSQFFIWLNDTTLQRNYWSQPSQDWTTDFAEATKFKTRDEADTESVSAEKSTKAEAVVQEILI